MEHLHDLVSIQRHESIPMSARQATAYFPMPDRVTNFLTQGQPFKPSLYDVPQGPASARPIRHPRIACLRPLSRYARVLSAVHA